MTYYAQRAVINKVRVPYNMAIHACSLSFSSLPIKSLILILHLHYFARCSETSSPSPLWMATPFHRVLKEEVVYSRWRSVTHKVVKLPKGTTVDFDIIDQKGAGVVTIFAWDSKTQTATLVKEYQPGPHQYLMGCAAGLIDECPTKHNSNPLTAAIWELEEELHLRGGTWYRLTDKAVAMDKYCVTRITPYLVIDPYVVDNPRQLDDEEEIEIIQGVTVIEILKMIRNGSMNMVGSWACLLAIEKLRELEQIL